MRFRVTLYRLLARVSRTQLSTEPIKTLSHEQNDPHFADGQMYGLKVISGYSQVWGFPMEVNQQYDSVTSGDGLVLINRQANARSDDNPLHFSTRHWTQG